MKIERLVVGQLQTNCYLVWDEESYKTVIIDPGDDGDFIIRKIQDLNLSPKYIIATHGHFDHILAVTELKLSFAIPFLMDSKDFFLFKRVQSSVKFFMGVQTDPSLPVDKFIKEEDFIKFGKEKLTIIETPGHTPGGISLYNKGFLFSGDTIFADGFGRTDYSYASEMQLKNSVKKLLKLPKTTVVYPGHGEEITLEEICDLGGI